MATNTPSKRPATPPRGGNIKATIWQNVSEKGRFFATTFSRPFKDQSGVWHHGTSFGLSDLEAPMNVACEAKKWMRLLMPWSVEPLHWETSGSPGASFSFMKALGESHQRQDTQSSGVYVQIQSVSISLVRSHSGGGVSP